MAGARAAPVNGSGHAPDRLSAEKTNGLAAPGRAIGSGRKSSASAKLKMAQLAPMPIASDRTATAVKPGLAASMRQP